MPSDPTIPTLTTLTIEHRNDIDGPMIFTSMEGAEAYLVAWAKGRWATEHLPEPMPTDPDTVISTYFDSTEETYHLKVVHPHEHNPIFVN